MSCPVCAELPFEIECLITPPITKDLGDALDNLTILIKLLAQKEKNDE